MQFKPVSVNIATMDYNAAVASAVAWLGNRYLLATPVRRLPDVERHAAQPHRRAWPDQPITDLILPAKRPHAEN
jgi:hypothetical protein